jgi:putative SOS response-associated peptidase YedK
MFEIGQVLDELAEFTPRWNIAPTQRAPVVRARPDGTRTLSLLRWGLVPRWTRAADERAALKDAGRLINARAETAPEKPSFREAVVRRRCLVPATGFYEWRREGVSVKQPFSITPASGVFFAFGGLWERWQPPSRADADAAERALDTGIAQPLETFSILTCAANADLSGLHDRMPVLVPPEAFAAWLDPTRTDLGSLAHLVQPARPGSLVLAPANPQVNSVRSEGPALLEAVQGSLFPGL